MAKWMLLSWREGKWEINGMRTSGLEGMLDPQTNTPHILSKTRYVQGYRDHCSNKVSATDGSEMRGPNGWCHRGVEAQEPN